MNSDFKIGDKVFLCDARNCFTAELNKQYTIISIKYDDYNKYTKIAFNENISESEELCYLDSRRFKKDIKYERKIKLKEILNND